MSKKKNGLLALAAAFALESDDYTIQPRKKWLIPKPNRMQVIGDGEIVGEIRHKPGLKMWEYDHTTGQTTEAVPVENSEGVKELHINPGCLYLQKLNCESAEAAFGKLFKNVK